MKTCFNCCFKTSKEDDIYCSLTLKMVMDGFGYGDSTICEKFKGKDQDLKDWIDRVDNHLIGRKQNETI